MEDSDSAVWISRRKLKSLDACPDVMESLMVVAMNGGETTLVDRGENVSEKKKRNLQCVV